MKSIYQKPITEVLTFRVNQHLMTGSIGVGNEYAGETILSRRHNSIFEDDAPTSDSGSIWDE